MIGCNEKSALVLNTNIPQRVTMSGYFEDDCELSNVSSRVDNKNVSRRDYEHGQAGHLITFENCFTIHKYTGKGISGGPVLDGKKVIGMCVYGAPGNGTTALKSEYIMQVIDKNFSF